jgi:K+-sensing histidine kinase KdpD
MTETYRFITVGLLAVVLVVQVSLIIARRIREKRERIMHKQLTQRLRAANATINNLLSNESMLYQLKRLTTWTWNSDTHNFIVGCTRSGLIHKDDTLLRSGNTAVINEQDFAENYLHKDDKHAIECFKDLCNGKQQSMHIVYRFHPYGNKSSYEWVNVNAIVTERDDEGKARSITGYNAVITQEEGTQEGEATKSGTEGWESSRRTDICNTQAAYLSDFNNEIMQRLDLLFEAADAIDSSSEADRDALPSREELLNKVEMLHKQIAFMIENAVCLSKIETGKWDIENRPLQISEAFRKIYHALRREYATKDIPLLFQTDDSVDTIETDPNSVSAILHQLINNAYAYTSQGHVTMGYTAAPADGYITFYVTDTGCGIDKKYHNTLFELQVKFDSDKPSPGLGLAICKRLITQLGGTIGVESETGKGSTFWFKLPLAGNQASHTPVTPEKQ